MLNTILSKFHVNLMDSTLVARLKLTYLIPTVLALGVPLIVILHTVSTIWEAFKGIHAVWTHKPTVLTIDDLAKLFARL